MTAPARGGRPTVDVRLSQQALRSSLSREVREGLSAQPKWLSPKWFYDARGSELFERITRLPEYYPTRCETEILQSRAPTVAALTGADTLVELGSGSSVKTRLLLDALTAKSQIETFVPFDVSESALRRAATEIAASYPGLEVHAIVGDFEQHLGALRGGGRRLVAFLGGTIGNLAPGERTRFLSGLASSLQPGDSLLLGTDLVKEIPRLEAAYNDASGVTAEFNLNVLEVLNRELAADFDPRRFSHVARFDTRNEWIEMRLRSRSSHTVRVGAIGLRASFGQGEEMLTEISAKFRRNKVEEELNQAGLEPCTWWTDRSGDFALSLSFVK